MTASALQALLKDGALAGEWVSFDAAASVWGDGEVWLDAGARINRADFGLTWNLLGMVSVNSTLTIHAVFTRR